MRMLVVERRSTAGRRAGQRSEPRRPCGRPRWRPGRMPIRRSGRRNSTSWSSTLDCPTWTASSCSSGCARDVSQTSVLVLTARDAGGGSGSRSRSRRQRLHDETILRRRVRGAGPCAADGDGRSPRRNWQSGTLSMDLSAKRARVRRTINRPHRARVVRCWSCSLTRAGRVLSKDQIAEHLLHLRRAGFAQCNRGLHLLGCGRSSSPEGSRLRTVRGFRIPLGCRQ